MHQIWAGSENPPSPGCPALLLRIGERCGVLTWSPCKSLWTSLCLHGFLSSTQGSLTLDTFLHAINEMLTSFTLAKLQVCKSKRKCKAPSKCIQRKTVPRSLNYGENIVKQTNLQSKLTFDSGKVPNCFGWFIFRLSQYLHKPGHQPGQNFLTCTINLTRWKGHFL